ncbi:MAG: DUF1002 domain-containing protein [Eubacterium sp.]|nr:DUF1002 domain-containing protein [Eubacterium sp.]
MVHACAVRVHLQRVVCEAASRVVVPCAHSLAVILSYGAAGERTNNMFNNRLMRRLTAGACLLSLAVGSFLPIRAGTTAQASVEVKPYIAFGASLKDSEKQKVMNLLGVKESQLPDYEVIEVTNDEEHEHLDKYIDKSVIGTRALSSVKIEEADAGSGIEVETKNINFCTEAMYVNALSTAGFTDAKVTVAGPFPLSGTAALVGAIKAYGAMQGEEVGEAVFDTAVDELVTTGEIIESVGSEKAAQLVAVVKNEVVKGDLTSEEDIKKAIDDGAAKLDVELTDEDKQKITDLMKKIGDLDLDLGVLEKSAQSVYDALEDAGIDLGEAKGWFMSILSSIGDFFANIGKAIGDFFKGIFS